MLTDNTILALGTAGVLILLALVQLFLAARHDRAVMAAGPIEELSVYEKRLNEKQRLMEDLEAQLEKRREVMAVVTDIEAEVDGLRRQKEELLTEWESLRDRRDEVAEVRRETEDAVAERQALKTEIAPLRAEYLAIREKLDTAEDLLRRIDALKREHGEIPAEVEALRDRKTELEDAGQRMARLATRAQELETANARLEDRQAAQESELGALAARAATERGGLASAQTEHGQVNAEVSALIKRRVEPEVNWTRSRKPAVHLTPVWRI